jgi:hypothetical protein
MINLTPVLNKEERDRVNKFNSRPFSETYKENNETDIYDMVKSKRKEMELPSPIKFNRNDSNTYKNLIINKATNSSPVSSIIESEQKEDSIEDKLWNFIKTNKIKTSSSIWEGIPIIWDILSRKDIVLSVVKKEIFNVAKDFAPEDAEKITEASLDMLKTWTNKLGSVTMGVLDTVQKPATKTLQYVWYGKDYLDNFTGKAAEVVSETIRWEDLPSIQKDVEARDLNRRLFLWVQKWITPNLNSMEENRRIILSQLSWQEKVNAEKFLEDNSGRIMATEIWLGLASWLWTTSTIKWALKTIPESNKILRGSLIALEETANPSIKNLSKVWAIMAFNATVYHQATWEWIFEWDKQAETWAYASFFALALKGMWLWGKATQKYVEKLMENDDFVDWLDSFFSKLADKTWAKTNLLSEEWPKPKVNKNIYKAFQELEAQQTLKSPEKFGDEIWMEGALFRDSEGFTPKTENITLLKKEGYMNSDDTYNFEKINSEFRDFKRAFPNLGKGAHSPKITSDFTEKAVNKAWENLKVDTDAVEWFMNYQQVKPNSSFDAKIKRAGLWNVDNTAWKNRLDYVKWEVYSGYANNMPKRLASLFWDNSKAVEADIKAISWKGRLSHLNNDMNNVLEWLWDDADDFSKYMWTKSRLEKAKTNPWLKTSVWWNILSKNELNATVKLYEDGIKGATYKKMWEQFSKINRELINYETEVWIRSIKEGGDLIKNNPFYVKDKLLDEITETFQKWGGYSKWETAIKRNIKEGSDKFDFNPSTFENTYEDFARRVMFASNNEKKKLAYDLFEELWGGKNTGMRILKKWETLNPKMWEIEDTFYIKWEKVNVAMNKSWSDMINSRDMGWTGLLKAMLRAPTSMAKILITGSLAPIHAVAQIVPETINAVLYAKSQKIWAGEYMKSWISAVSWGKINKNAFIANPEIKNAMEQIAAITWADFSFYKAMESELADAGGRIIPKLQSTGTLGKLNRKLWGVGHTLEMNTLRLPLIESALKAQWLSPDMFSKYIQEAWEFNIPIDKYLKKKWINVSEAWGIARDVFNYADASNAMRRIGRYVPYANIAAVNTQVMKRLIFDNPKVWLWIIWAWVTASQLLYEFNYSWNKGDILRKQEWYLTHQSGFFINDWESDEWNMIRVKNIPIIEWIYPLVVEANESIRQENREFSIKTSMNKSIKDITYGVDLEGGLKGSLGNVIPWWYKQAVEAASNYNFYFDWQIISTYNKRWDEKLLEFDAKTRPIYKWMALALSHMMSVWNPMTLRDDWIYEWGNQVSPKLLQHLFSYVDPMTYRQADFINKVVDISKSEIEVIMWKKEKSEDDMKKIYSLFSKTYNLKNWTDALYQFKQEWIDNVSKHYKSQIKQNIMTLPSSEVPEYIELMRGKEDGDFWDYINKQIKRRKKQDKWWKEMLIMSELNANQIAQRMYNDANLWKDYIKFRDAFNQWLISRDKHSNVAKHFRELNK